MRKDDESMEKNRSVAWALIIIAVLAAASFMRNAVYRDPVRLWEDTAAKSPAKTRVLDNLGSAYAARNRFDEAIGKYNAALAAGPDLAVTYYNRGLAYSRQGKFDKAVED